MAIIPPPDPNATPRQLSLPLAIEDVPDIVRRHGLIETHRYPYVSKGGTYWFVRRVPTATAWSKYPEVELHSATARTALVLDCDSDPRDYLAVAFGDPRIRPPNWIVSSSSGHAHVVYTLARPVLRGEQAPKKPLFLLGRIAEFYAAAYQADSGYVGLLTHNPVHPRYQDNTTWWCEAPWWLEDLAADIPPRWRIPPKPVTVEGRNSTLFRAAMRHFGKPRNWDASTDLGDVLAWIEACFDDWYGELPHNGWHRNECRWIAKSVTRYCRANLASGRTQRNFPLIQAARGRLSGQARRKNKPLEADPQPWLDLGISRATYYRSRGAPPPTLTDLAPWKELGISRTTWYARRKRGLL